MKIILFCFSHFFAFAQLHDNTWLIGYKGAVDSTDEFGITQFGFLTGSLQLKENNDLYSGFAENNTVFSDSAGKTVAIFNGYWINDKSWKKMKGRDSIWYEEEPNLFGYCDTDIPQAGMFLPWPGHPDSLLLFYVSQGNAGTPSFVELASLHLQYALIRLSGNNGLGEVIIKRHVVLEDTIQYGRLSACKHANGRDWWLMINEINTNRWYRYLLDPYGLHLLGQQEVGLPMMDGIGQSVYSPDGRYYASFNAYDANNDYLHVYDFDRCTGLFSNHRQKNFAGFIGGVAISPNSRFLYLSYTDKLYQYDLEDPDILASQILVAEYDGYVNTSQTIFYQAQLAPDNKIYICVYGSTKVIHVIHNPDEPGSACQFEQHGIHLPVYNAESVTNSPYYRLGPLDGSSCDTLGLDNHPKAWYRYQQDTLDFLNISFHDLSYYEPETWSWDFGDGSPLSSVRHPAHLFDSAGVYQVCLTVGNMSSADTHCKTLYLGVSAVGELQNQAGQVILYPNPVSDRISVYLKHVPAEVLQLKIIDLNGKILKKVQLSGGTDGITLDVSDLPTGVYICTVSDAMKMYPSLKLVIQR